VREEPAALNGRTGGQRQEGNGTIEQEGRRWDMAMGPVAGRGTARRQGTGAVALGRAALVPPPATCLPTARTISSTPSCMRAMHQDLEAHQNRKGVSPPRRGLGPLPAVDAKVAPEVDPRTRSAP